MEPTGTTASANEREPVPGWAARQPRQVTPPEVRRMHPLEAPRHPFVSALQTLSLLLFSALVALLGWRAGVGVTDLASGAAVALALPLAFLLADFASGLAHWLCDTFFAEDTPLVGPALIQPFREHHRDPLAITRHDFFERNHSNAASVLPILAWGALAGPAPAESPAQVFANAFLACFGLAIAATNQIHAWAHAPRTPRAVRWLQRAGLVLRPGHHVRHHRDGASYCITGGWLDAWLERVQLFERLERAVRRAQARWRAHARERSSRAARFR